MAYDGINNIELDGEENEWLDVTYTAKKYLTEEQEQADTVRKIRGKKNHGIFNRVKGGFSNIFHSETDQEHQQARTASKKSNFRSAFLKAVVSVVILAVLVGGVFILDNTMEGKIVETAKQTFLAPVFSTGVTPSALQEITIPCTVSIDNVENGVISFSGGRVLLSFTDGTVSAVGENSITVAINDSTSIVYENVTDILVGVGDTVEVYSVLAKYVESATASILYNGELVINVVGSSDQIKWSV